MFPEVAYNILYLLMNSICWGIAFTDMAYILCFLMWRISCISWCGLQYIVFPGVTYILFFTHLKHFLLWHIYCISWCGVYTIRQSYIAIPGIAYTLYYLTGILFVFPVQYIGSPDMMDLLFFRHTRYFLVWRTSVCSCVSYLLYFLMWRTLHRVSSYGVYIVLQT